MPIRVRLSRKKGWRMPLDTVKVARPSRWGNPFVVRPDIQQGTPINEDMGYVAVESAEEAVRVYRIWLTGSEDATPLFHNVRGLRGKNLACWCPLDKPCHADVLLELANVEEGSR